jgi:hypothetical protein
MTSSKKGNPPGLPSNTSSPSTTPTSLYVLTQNARGHLLDRLAEAYEQGWLGEVAAIEASLAAADQKLTAMRRLAAKHTIVRLGMPDFRPGAGRSSRS